MHPTIRRSLLVLVVLAASGLPGVPARGEEPYTARTAARPDVALPMLEVMLQPLTRVQLEIEAEAWLKLLHEKAMEISNAELAVKLKTREIQAAEQAATAVKEAEAAAADADRKMQDAAVAGDENAEKKAAAAAAKAEQTAAEAQEAVRDATEVEQETAANKEADAVATAAAETAAAAKPATLEDGATGPAQAAEVKGEVKDTLLTSLSTLREQRVALVDRANMVLDALEAKGGDAEQHRLYVNVVSGTVIDISDWDAALATVVGWLKSKEGGLRWAANVGQFAGIVIAAWLLSLIIGAATERAMNRAMRKSKRMSSLMREFVSKSVRRLVLLIGVVVALSALELEIGPLMAVIAGAGFVVAFALQDSLSNLASGIMILFYRPFDVGDVIDVAGVSGKVKSMNLVSTTVTSFDNKVVIVPNNSVWQNVITNATGSKTRRVDLVFGIGYQSDIAAAQAIMERIIAEHPAVLDDPEPLIKVHELADSSVNFICRPWVKTEDYWTVYWDVTRAVKEQFDKNGISIPFPQRDVHVYHTTGGAEAPVAEVAPAAGEHAVS